MLSIYTELILIPGLLFYGSTSFKRSCLLLKYTLRNVKVECAHLIS